MTTEVRTEAQLAADTYGDLQLALADAKMMFPEMTFSDTAEGDVRINLARVGIGTVGEAGPCSEGGAVMSTGVWSRLRGRVGPDRAEEAWNRHVRYRGLYRQLDHVQAALKARTAWMDELAEGDLAEMLRGLTGCIDAVRAAGSDAPDRPEGTH
ncbi:hypothetical protein [Streptomyces sp. NPDC054765]